MKEERDDELWQLLGKVKPPEVSPFFSRNVLRVVRELEEKPVARWAWLKSWKLVGAAAATVAVASWAALQFTSSSHRPENGVAISEEAILESTDYDVISSLDELLAYQETSVWLDDAAVY